MIEHDRSTGPDSAAPAADHSVKTHTPKEPVNDDARDPASTRPREIGGRKGPEPTRFGDWEKNGRCIDF